MSSPVMPYAPEAARALFVEQFGPRQQLNTLFVPLRICPLGAHVDHQYGEVLAGALSVGFTVVFAPRVDDQVHVYSSLLQSRAVRTWQDIARNDHWARFVDGAMSALRAAFPQRTNWQGMDAVVLGAGTAAGLSSSAAVGVAYLLSLAECNQLSLEPQQLIELDAHIEQSFLGLNNGTLDPAAIVLSRAEHLTLIDTRSNACSHHRAGGKFRFLAVYSGISQALTPANFNRRVQESWGAAAAIGQHLGRSVNGARLGDYQAADYAAARASLAPLLKLRADHYFSETERVRAGVTCWEQGDVQGLGALMNASAASSMHNYECGATPVRDLVGVLQQAHGVAGARFCGPGFRGCCIALLNDDATADEVATEVLARYAELHPQLADKGWHITCVIDDGARLMPEAAQ